MIDTLGNKYFKIKSPPTVMEIIDGEAIMINAEKGTYYNLSPQATLILESLLNTNNLDEISSFNNLESDVIHCIERMINTLITEDILISIEKKESNTEPSKLTIKNFEKDIVLTVYDDMQDMLLLDPIHEADEVVGWPTKK
jgi:hypothetical protein